MAKDPAFLLYSKDFYEGTRMMLPEERACYLDLMIYQHQNGNIPSDLRRVLMYCSGIDEATLKATLKAKFKQKEDGTWFNAKLDQVIQDRTEYSNKQSINGTIGQFWKKAKSELSAKDFKALKDFAYQTYGKENLITLIKKHKTLEGSLKALLKHLVNEDAIEDENVNKEIFNKKTFSKKLIELGAEEQHIKDWFKARDKKKAVYSETAFNQFVNECEKNNFPLAEAVKIAAQNSWSGFKYSWVNNASANKQQNFSTNR